MSVEMAGNVVKLLKAQFGKSFPEAGMKLVWKDICDADDKALEAAFDYFVLNNRFPSPQQLKDQAVMQGKLIAAKAAADREDEWSRTKGGATRSELEKKGSIFTREQSDAHGRHALQAIRLMMSSASQADKIECFRVMDQQYPGVGWALEGMRLQKEWARQDKRRHWRDVAEASPQFQHRYQVEQERKGFV